jgi:hypothetical protein
MAPPLLRSDSILIEEERDVCEESAEEFDRLAFARRALSEIQPPGMLVAVCPGRKRLHVEAGRSWGRGEGARWGLVIVPPRASREAIVLALAELQGLGGGEGSRSTPYALDVLLSHARPPLPG